MQDQIDCIQSQLQSDCSAFNQMAEQWLTPAVRSQFGVELYVRYKDDGFVALNADPDVRFEFFKALKAKSRFFVLELDSISDE